MLDTKPVEMMNKSLEAFALGAQWVTKSNGFRLDASYYNAKTAQALSTLQHSGRTIRPLGGEVQRVFMPGRFKRVYVNAAHGIPFLSGSHIVHFQPANLKYLSRAAHKKTVASLLVQEGWVLVTRSGTIGRVVMVGNLWNGWAASEHLLRIVPKDGGLPGGYIFAFLASPLGQAQFNGIYGAVVDELTEEHIEAIRIPIPTTPQEHAEVEHINSVALEALRHKEEAVALTMASVGMVNGLFT